MNKRITALALALTLSLSLTGCQSAPAQTLASPSEVDAAPAESVVESASETTTETESPATEETADETASTSVDAEAITALEKLAKDLADTPIGTAGSSLAIMETANDALPLGNALQAHPEIFIDAFVAQTEEEPELRGEWLSTLTYTVEGLVQGDEATLGRAADAGVTVNPSDLSAEEWATLSETLAELLPEA